MKIAVTIGKDGSIETLLKDSVINVRQFGEAKIERITTIEFEEANQKFFIKWLLGPMAGAVHSHDLDFHLFGNGESAGNILPMYFDSYEDAVAHEINCVNALRLRGFSFVK